MLSTGKYFTLICLFLLISGIGAYAQRSGFSSSGWQSPSSTAGTFLGGGASLLKMDGDYGSKQKGVFTSGLSLLAEHKFQNRMILRSAFTKGTLEERFTGRYSYFDHHTRMMTCELFGMVLFPALTNCRQKVQISPYLGVGAGLIHFQTFADLYDREGNRYHFWKDGTVRMVPEGVPDLENAPVVVRDGIFETYIDTLGLYPNIAAKFPLEVGFRIMFGRNIGAYISGRYTITTTDYIDHGVAYRDPYLTVRSPQNHFTDGYYSLSLAVIYRLEGGHSSPKPYSRKQRKPRQCGRF
jgi:hypothetical protein